MAQFKTHLSFGFILAVGGSVALIIFSLIASNALVFPFSVAILLGSILPDLDSDEGIPFKITFWSFSVVSAGFVFYYLFSNNQKDLLLLIGLPFFVFIFIRFFLGSLFKRITHHRGMFHSLPAALLALLGTYLATDFFEIQENIRQILSLGVGAGYLSHLVLDEIYATINFNGKTFKPSKSLGSALKMFSSSPAINIFTYLGLILLIIVIL